MTAPPTRTATGRRRARGESEVIELERAALPGRRTHAEPEPPRWRAAVLEWVPNLSTLAVMIIVLVFAWPAKWGGQSTIVIVGGHSMEPTYQVGYMVAAWDSPPELGDIVVYRVPDGRVGAGIEVIHRIVEVDVVDGETVYHTKGDNNANPDPWDLTDADILGVSVFSVPFAGATLSIVGHPLFLALVSGALTLLWLWPVRVREPEEPTVHTDVDPVLAEQMTDLLAVESVESVERGRHLASDAVDPALAERMRRLLTFRVERHGRHVAARAADDRSDEKTGAGR